jgi:hypothetical protein
MAIILNDNIAVNAPKPQDDRYFHPDNRPWNSINEVLTVLPSSRRFVELLVNINGVVHVFKNDINTLVPFTSDSSQISSNFINVASGSASKDGGLLVLNNENSGSALGYSDLSKEWGVSVSQSISSNIIDIDAFLTLNQRGNTLPDAPHFGSGSFGSLFINTDTQEAFIWM